MQLQAKKSSKYLFHEGEKNHSIEIANRGSWEQVRAFTIQRHFCYGKKLEPKLRFKLYLLLNVFTGKYLLGSINMS